MNSAALPAALAAAIAQRRRPLARLVAKIMARLSALLGIRSATTPGRRRERKPIPIRHVPAVAIARGFADPRQRAGSRRIVVTIDAAGFERVRVHAAAAGIPFAAAVRQLIERGLAAAPEPQP
jgi:hypothetical protein